MLDRKNNEGGDDFDLNEENNTPLKSRTPKSNVDDD